LVLYHIYIAFIKKKIVWQLNSETVLGQVYQMLWA